MFSRNYKQIVLILLFVLLLTEFSNVNSFGNSSGYTTKNELFSNNIKKIDSISQSNFKIGFIQTHGEKPMSGLQNFYKGFGIQVDSILYSLSNTNITQYNILFVGEGNTNWSQSEITNIENYIQAGGILVSIGDYNLSYSLQSILTNYGVSFTGSQDGYSGPSTNINSSHVLMKNVTTITLPNILSSLQVNTTKAHPLVNDTTNLGTYIAYADPGSGHLLVVGDNLDENIYEGNNSIFFENILFWHPLAHEIGISLQIPSRQIVNETALVNISLNNLGTTNESNIVYTLKIDNKIVLNKTKLTILANTTDLIQYNLTIDYTGEYNVTAFIKERQNDTISINNYETHFLDVYNPLVKVGIISIHGSRSLTNLQTFYQQQGYSSNIITSLPNIYTLDSYTHVFLAESTNPTEWTTNELQTLQYYITNGGILSILGDSVIQGSIRNFTKSFGITYIDSLYNSPSQITTKINKQERLLKGINSLYLPGVITTLKIDPSNSTYLIQEGYSQNTVGAVTKIKSGQLIVLSDDLDQSLQNNDNSLLFKNILFLGPVMNDLALSIHSKDYLKPNETTQINISMYNRGLNNITAMNYIVEEQGNQIKTGVIQSLKRGETYQTELNWTAGGIADINVTIYYYGAFTPLRFQTYQISKVIRVLEPINVQKNQDFEYYYTYKNDTNNKLLYKIKFGDYNNQTGNQIYSLVIQGLDSSGNQVIKSNETGEINIFTRQIVESNQNKGDYFRYIIKTKQTMFSSIEIDNINGKLTGENYCNYQGNERNGWLVSNTTLKETFCYDKQSGVLVSYSGPDAVVNLYTTNTFNYIPEITTMSPNGGETLAGKSIVSWTAKDMNNDNLTYSIWIKSDNSWELLAKNVSSTELSIDTTKYSNGNNYQMKLEVNDGKNSSIKISGLFAIQNNVVQSQGLNLGWIGDLISWGILLSIGAGIAGLAYFIIRKNEKNKEN